MIPTGLLHVNKVDFLMNSDVEPVTSAVTGPPQNGRVEWRHRRNHL